MVLGAGDLNSDPHACIASVLPTEPPPQPVENYLSLVKYTMKAVQQTIENSSECDQFYLRAGDRKRRDKQRCSTKELHTIFSQNLVPIGKENEHPW